MSPFKTIDAATLHGIIKQDNLVLIDVRNDDEVSRGIIQGAKHIPLASLPQLFDKL
jgi:rhodanese-related sulfurtransferase